MDDSNRPCKMMKEQFIERMTPYAGHKDYDTHDLTEIASYFLKEDGVDHVVMSGEVYVGDESEPKFWIETEDGYIIDFMATGTPGGVFRENEARHLRYIGQETMVMANSVRFEVITGESPF